MPTSQSLQTAPSCPSESRSTSSRPSAARRIFDTVENMFFKEGDELSQLAPDENDLDEVTEMVPCPKSRRRLAVFIAAAAVAMVGLAVLVL